MAAVRAYLRIGKMRSGKFKTVATKGPSMEPVYQSGEPLPTAAFAIDFVIPDLMFERAAEVLATVAVDPEVAKIAAEVETPDRDDG